MPAETKPNHTQHLSRFVAPKPFLSLYLPERISELATIGNDQGGLRRILFYAADGSRKTIRLGKCSKRDAESLKIRVEALLSAELTGGSLDRETSMWLGNVDSRLRSKLETVGLVEPLVPIPAKASETMAQCIDDFIGRVGKTKKPGTIAVWKQVKNNLLKHMPDGIALDKVTKGHAKQFHEAMKLRKLAGLTIAKHVRISRQIFQDSLEWQKIPINPFAGVKASCAIPRNNVEVPRGTIDKILPHCDQIWKTIVALSRYGGLRCPSEVLSLQWSHVDFENGLIHIPEPKVEHHEGRGIRVCPLFPELRTVLEITKAVASNIDGYVVDKPSYRQAADTGEGWKNSNLRTQYLKILGRAKVESWSRLFHSMRASRQTELEREFPLHVVCSWLGNSPKVAQRSYLLVTSADFQKASSGGEKSGTKSGTIGAKNGTKSCTAGASTCSQEIAIDQGNHSENIIFPGKSIGLLADGEGFEPTVQSPVLRFSRPVH